MMKQTDNTYTSCHPTLDAGSPAKRFFRGLRVKPTMTRCSIAAILIAFSFTTCSDWLDIKPLDRTVQEDFWKTRADVESVVLACYRAMEEENFMDRIIVGGEVRSDNVRPGTDIELEVRNIMNVDIQPSNSRTSWIDFYKVINYCNLVITYAPEVNGIDPGYSTGFMRAHQAEAYTLRALCYFYLVRIYGDYAPYIDFAYTDDEQEFYVPNNDNGKTAGRGDSILNMEIEHLKDAERWAVNMYAMGSSENKSRVTKATVRALMADIYLWLNRYDECIEACDKVIANYLPYDEYLEVVQDETKRKGTELTLVSNEDTPGYSFRDMFSYTNTYSMESIFEMPFTDGVIKNARVKTYYGNAETANGGQLAAIVQNEYLFTQPDVENSTDLRGVASYFLPAAASGGQTGVGTARIYKYVNNYRDNIDLTDASTRGLLLGSWIPKDSETPNWIFYRMADIFLMKAEALVERNQGGNGKDLEEALDMLNITYKRANPTGDLLAPVLDQVTMRKEVLAERQREFLFEGKRWFDLLRRARRSEGKQTPSDVLELLSHKYSSADVNWGQVSSRLLDKDALFLPVNQSELKRNPGLIQNPYYKSISTK
jgi:hypothetical protein